MPQLTPDVFEGSNGYLFLSGHGNDVAGLISQPPETIAALARRWVDAICRRGERLSQAGVSYRHCFVPDKLSVYREEAEGLWNAPASPAEHIERLGAPPELQRYLVPLTTYFRKQKNHYQMYFKTDTHWTIEGCFSAYQMLCASLQIPQRRDPMPRTHPTVEMYGDLGIRLWPPRKETFRFGAFGRSARREYANDVVRLHERGKLGYQHGVRVGSIVRFRCENAPSDKRLAIFGDSFSEHRLHYLTGLFADTVRETMFVWSADIDHELVADFEPDIVISEVAERFISRVPSDDVDLRAHARERVHQALDDAVLQSIARG